MATAVESPGIASAKEEAAAILFARQPQTPPVVPVATLEQPVQMTQTKSKYPTFASYHDPEPMPARPQTVNTTNFKPYQTFDEVKVDVAPQVVRPYIDSSDYVTSMAATTVTTAEPVETVVEAPQTVTVVQSPLDQALEDDTQYVVKFKNSTIVAATIVATIFVLMAVLFVVNVVNLVTVTAEVNTLWQESTTLEKTLTEERAQLEQARGEAAGNAGSTDHNIQYVPSSGSLSTASSAARTNSSFFDWLCRALSRLFG